MILSIENMTTVQAIIHILIAAALIGLMIYNDYKEYGDTRQKWEEWKNDGTNDDEGSFDLSFTAESEERRSQFPRDSLDGISDVPDHGSGFIVVDRAPQNQEEQDELKKYYKLKTIAKYERLQESFERNLPPSLIFRRLYRVDPDFRYYVHDVMGSEDWEEIRKKSDETSLNNTLHMIAMTWEVATSEYRRMTG